MYILVESSKERYEEGIDTTVLSVSDSKELLARYLEKEIREGNFREDLYHRIGVILIKVPPLRERKGDVAILIDYFLESICREYNIPTKKIDAEAIAKLSDRRWSGNIRELRNIVERLVVLGNNPITEEDIESYC